MARFAPVLVIAVAACSVTPADLEKWKTTQKGPEKLAAVLLDDKYDADIRAQAAVAMADVGDIQQWDRLDKAFKVIPEPQRSQVIDAMVPHLTKMIREGTEPPSPPLRTQVAAKDLLHLVLPYSAGASRTQIEDLLIEWSVADFNQRFYIGRKSIDVLIQDVGQRASEALVELLTPDCEIYDKVTEYLDRIAPEDLQHKAGANLVERAKKRMADYSGKIDQSLLVSLGRMGGPEVRAFLLDLAMKPDLPAQTHRGGMMAYLQFEMQSKDDMEKLFTIAEDTKIDQSVRNWAYDAIVLIGDKEQKTRIVKLLHTTGGDRDRFRGVGVDELLRLLGLEGIPFILEELTLEEEPWEDWLDLRDYVPVRFTQDRDGKTISGADSAKALEQLRPFLTHKQPFARGVAAYAIGLVGDASDLKKLESMKKDGGKLEGWKFAKGEEVVENFPTVGSVAGWAVGKIKERTGG